MVAVNKKALLESVWEKVDEDQSFSGFDRTPFNLEWLATCAQEDDLWRNYEENTVTGRLVQRIKSALFIHHDDTVVTESTASIHIQFDPYALPAPLPPGASPSPGPLHSHDSNAAVRSPEPKRQRTVREFGISSESENPRDGFSGNSLAISAAHKFSMEVPAGGDSTSWESNSQGRGSNGEAARAVTSASNQVPGSERLDVAAPIIKSHSAGVVLASTSMDESEKAVCTGKESTNLCSDIENGARDDAFPKIYPLPSFDFGSTPQFLRLYGYNENEVDEVVLRLATSLPTESTLYASYPQTVSPEWRNMFSNFRLKAPPSPEYLMDDSKEEGICDGIILSPADMSSVRDCEYWELDAIYSIASTEEGMTGVICKMQGEAEAAALHGKEQGWPATVIISHRCVTETRMIVPSLLACAGVHQHLVSLNLRHEVYIIVEAGDAREVLDSAALLGYGADAVCPAFACEALAYWNHKDKINVLTYMETEELAKNYIETISRGVHRICSEHGLWINEKHLGQLLFDAKDITPGIVDSFFPGTVSSGVGSTTLKTLHEATCNLHSAAFPLQVLSELSMEEEEGVPFQEENESDVYVDNVMHEYEDVISVVEERSILATNGVGDESKYANVMQQVEASPDMDIDQSSPNPAKSQSQQQQQPTKSEPNFLLNSPLFGCFNQGEQSTNSGDPGPVKGKRKSGNGKEKATGVEENQETAIPSSSSVALPDAEAHLLGTELVLGAEMVVGVPPVPGGVAVQGYTGFAARLQRNNLWLYNGLLAHAELYSYVSSMEKLVAGTYLLHAEASTAGRFCCRRHPRVVTDHNGAPVVIGTPDASYLYIRLNRYMELVSNHDGSVALVLSSELSRHLAACYSGQTLGEQVVVRYNAMHPLDVVWNIFSTLDMRAGAGGDSRALNEFEYNLAELAAEAIMQMCHRGLCQNKRRGGKKWHCRRRGRASLELFPDAADFDHTNGAVSKINHKRFVCVFGAPPKCCQGSARVDFEYDGTPAVYSDVYGNPDDSDSLNGINLYPNLNSATKDPDFHLDHDISIADVIKACHAVATDPDCEAANTAILVGQSKNIFLPTNCTALTPSLGNNTLYLLPCGRYISIQQGIDMGVLNHHGLEVALTEAVMDIVDLSREGAETLGASAPDRLGFDALNHNRKSFNKDVEPQYVEKRVKLQKAWPRREGDAIREFDDKFTAIKARANLATLPLAEVGTVKGPVNYKPWYDYLQSKATYGEACRTLSMAHAIDDQFGARIPEDKVAVAKYAHALAQKNLSLGKAKGLDVESEDFKNLDPLQQKRVASLHTRAKDRLDPKNHLYYSLCCFEWTYAGIDSRSIVNHARHQGVECSHSHTMVYPLWCYRHNSRLSGPDAEALRQVVSEALPIIRFLSSLEPTFERGEEYRFPGQMWDLLADFLKKTPEDPRLPDGCSQLLAYVKANCEQHQSSASLRSLVHDLSDRKVLKVGDRALKIKIAQTPTERKVEKKTPTELKKSSKRFTWFPVSVSFW